jgi:hypothetical protein
MGAAWRALYATCSISPFRANSTPPSALDICPKSKCTRSVWLRLHSHPGTRQHTNSMRSALKKKSCAIARALKIHDRMFGNVVSSLIRQLWDAGPGSSTGRLGENSDEKGTQHPFWGESPPYAAQVRLRIFPVFECQSEPWARDI